MKYPKLFLLSFFSIQILPSLVSAEEKYIRGLDPGSVIPDIYIFYVILLGIGLFLLILAKPVYGLAFNVIFYSFLQVSSGISIMELLSAAIIYAFIAGWVAWTVTHRFTPDRDYHNCQKIFLLFLLYLAINGVTAYVKGIPILDIIRDTIPISNLFMFLVLKAFMKQKKEIAFVIKVQLSIIILIVLRGIFIMAVQYYPWMEFLPKAGSNYHSLVLAIVGIGGYLFFKKKKLWVILSIIAFSSLLLTTNRTIFLAAIGCIMMMTLMLRHSKRVIGLVFGTAMLSFLLYSAVSFYKADLFSAKKEKFETFAGQLSILNRLDEIKQSGIIFINNPIMGIGIGHRYRFWRHFIKDKGPGYMVSNFTHSDLMNFLAKLGIVGTLIFYVFYYKLCKLAWLVWKRGTEKEDQGRGLICFTLLIAAFIVGQSTPIIQHRPASLLLGMIMGYTFCLYREVFEKVKTGYEHSAVN